MPVKLTLDNVTTFKNYIGNKVDKNAYKIQNCEPDSKANKRTQQLPLKHAQNTL